MSVLQDAYEHTHTYIQYFTRNRCTVLLEFMRYGIVTYTCLPLFLLNVHVYVNIHVHACIPIPIIHAHLLFFLLTFMYICVYVFIYICKYTCSCMYINPNHTCIPALLFTEHPCIRMYVCMLVSIHVHAYRSIPIIHATHSLFLLTIHVYMYVCVFIYIYM